MVFAFDVARPDPRVEELQRTATLQDILRTIPKQYFQKNPRKAMFSLVTNIFLVAVGYASLVLNPWGWLFPVLWLFTGTALTGFFVIAHDCAHRSFADSRRVNDFIGHLVLLPILYPFHSWRIKHDQHHRYTNNLAWDNAWTPLSVEEFQQAPRWYQIFYRTARTWGWWTASIGHWIALHFSPGLYKEGRDRQDMQFSVGVVVAFAMVFFPLLWWFGGAWAVLNLWLMPFLVYHFWMSTFTLVHHTVEPIPFYQEEQWNPVVGQLFSTVHCRYPAWVEFMCHDINVHIPHHISTGIPHYNLRPVHHALKEHWASYMHETEFSWPLMQHIITRCHLHDGQGGYLPFKDE
ncbi:fatty acid desaturase [Candidatus Cyanaurora vandensis]|uniref:fatty acid desaturase n=1 Tax=Candidatus Cyanaurora vandensis TaxID=2714958 RepID=UPI0025803E78|nr:fatty acid desaturase [Candidatus Cyanaurora vandensis]